RALRAPASASVLCARPEAPGAKSGNGSLRLSRHWLAQPAARTAAFCDDAGGDGGLAENMPGEGKAAPAGCPAAATCSCASSAPPLLLLQLQVLLEPFGITKFHTDGWDTYERHIEVEKPEVGKENTQQIESTHINLRT
ncbi:MAG: IS1 family transposase, partial [Candidatus Neomarinimicrobiota bacterium]